MSNNSFSQLKSSRKSSLEKLTGELTKMQSGSQQSNGPDERFWTPTVDKMVLQ
jgi:hypothetical protein